eukprot:Blabericola_migrator_1__10534@NODE_5985_length_628_cov_50_522282_g1292_i1_p1_GENE_NODE_5985_length_628_cov_50_522282_g1292_i1NODE_5985_length_628_cov_50_522282_g1292_i1_p1_ORF_typecomplete_len106_score19_13CorA/PF01544_18/0_0066DOCK_N/PF16172_5/0_024HEPN_Swt1/PF18731_1/0_045Peptidase_M13_N/PF05649_13/0_078LzipperMIP1/PF14389_6/0_15_NODE_5985_length_628_cov_50_522282_g1292_i1111428
MLLHGQSIILSTAKYLLKLLDDHLATQRLDFTYEEITNTLREWPATIFSQFANNPDKKLLNEIYTFEQSIAHTQTQLASKRDATFLKTIPPQNFLFRVCGGPQTT